MFTDGVPAYHKLSSGVKHFPTGLTATSLQESTDVCGAFQLDVATYNDSRALVEDYKDSTFCVTGGKCDLNNDNRTYDVLCQCKKAWHG